MSGHSYFDVSLDDALEARLHRWIERGTGPPEETSSEESSLEELHDKIAWVRKAISHHTMWLSECLPPTFPFLLTFDPRTRIFAISFANILCIDIDEKEGLEKQTSAELIQHYAEANDLTFRLYETDRGMHGYCTSRTFDPSQPETWEVMRKMKCDVYYIAFSTFRGFSYRLSPKLFDSAETQTLGVPKNQQDFDLEFVQREWCPKIVGPTSREDPALVSMIDLTMQLTRYIKSKPDLRFQVSCNLHWDSLLRDISKFARTEYLKLLEQPCRVALHRWLRSENTLKLPYINDSMVWTPCKNPRHLWTKHPIDGKMIVIYWKAKQRRWYWVHAEKHNGPFESQSHAKMAVAETLANQMPKNVEMALSRAPDCPHRWVWLGHGHGLRLWLTVACCLLVLVLLLVSRLPGADGVEAVRSVDGASSRSQLLLEPGGPAVWSCAEVAEWITSIFSGVPEAAQSYGARIREVGVDGEMLLHCVSDACLEGELGITRLHREKLLRALSQLQ